ncbi:MAG: Phosphonoacetaldehyde hydrolase [Bacteroidota bacterium]|jgi:phosphonatase-like hydrolase
MKAIKLVVFDMAGTTVLDNHEVELCFKQAAVKNELHASDERILALQGYAKIGVFRTLWAEQLGKNHSKTEELAQKSYQDFKHILEQHYRTQPVLTTEGCLETFEFLHQQGIYIALTTGFYRDVANIILEKLGWGQSLNQGYKNINNKSGIHLSVTPDEVGGVGRPAPDMIEYAVRQLGIQNKKQVINIGDTPVDLQFGKNAGIGYALGVCNGTHTHDQLKTYPNDGLLLKISDLIDFISHD